MESEDGRELLGGDSPTEGRDNIHTHAAALLPHVLWTKLSKWAASKSPHSRVAWNRRQTLRRLYLVFAFSILAFSVYLFERHTDSSTSRLWPNLRQNSNAISSSITPFTGAFSRFPRVSALPERQKRMTVIGVWNGDSFPTYLRHFFYTIQLNADVLDLLVINRLRNGRRCLDFESAGVNITWGGNVKVHCLDDKEWNDRHVQFLCSTKYGWSCNSTEYSEVAKEYQSRKNKKNFTWRPFLGYAFQDVFANPSNPFWAWMDLDLFVGNFARYPFNILSQLSILTGGFVEPNRLWMLGQLTAFNMDDEALGTAWKKFPSMKSAAHFTKYIEGKMPESPEEGYWSYGYLRSEIDLPGSDLSYGVYPGINGDDYYDGHLNYNSQPANQTFLISGKDILLASTSYSRKEIEDLIRIEREDPVDDLGGIGWTGGEDGSAYLLDRPGLSSSEAKLLAISNAKSLHQSPPMHDGIVEDQIITNCSRNGLWEQCVALNPLTVSNPPIMRSTLIRLKEQQPGHIFRRLERDHRPRGYERKLMKHHLLSKGGKDGKMPWLEFPPFEITEDLVLKFRADALEVFKMGPSREKTLFYRKAGEKSVG